LRFVRPSFRRARVARGRARNPHRWTLIRWGTGSASPFVVKKSDQRNNQKNRDKRPERMLLLLIAAETRQSFFPQPFQIRFFGLCHSASGGLRGQKHAMIVKRWLLWNRCLPSGRAPLQRSAAITAKQLIQRIVVPAARTNRRTAERGNVGYRLRDSDGVRLCLNWQLRRFAISVTRA